jgi:CRISPR-associated protein Cmr4
MLSRLFLLHALSPLHAGTGQAADIVDLPIARMRSTGIPIVPGSSIKGVLREERSSGEQERWQAVFGPRHKPEENAGALVVSDARLLALPVRSFRGTFAWVTSPLLLTLAGRDLETVGLATPPLPIVFETRPQAEAHGAKVASFAASANVYQPDQLPRRLYLEDLDLGVVEDAAVQQWATLLAPLVSASEPNVFRRRFVVVDDETMTFLWETATQIDMRVRIDSQTRTVVDGALWVEESLPPETLLLVLLAAERSRRKEVAMTPHEVLAFAMPSEAVLQFGGKATVGRGRSRLVPFSNGG